MKIGVSGAGGQLGRTVVNELLGRGSGHDIVAISREPDKLPAEVGDRRLGDYDRPETLATAYAGLDRVLLIPSADLRPGVRSAQAAAAVEGAAAAGVGHIFLLSATGTREKAEPAMGAAYWTAEHRLLTSDAKGWTILRMNYFAETLAQEAQMAAATGMLPALAENRVAYVSRDDVAAGCAGALLGDNHNGATYALCGPAAITGAERAELLSKLVGKPLQFATLPEEQLRAGLGQAQLPPFIVDAIVSMQVSQAEGAYDIVTGDLERLAGRAPQTLQAVLSNLAASAEPSKAHG